MRTRIFRIAGVLLLSFFANGVNGAKSFATDPLLIKTLDKTLPTNVPLQYKAPPRTFSAVSLIEARNALPPNYASGYTMNQGVSNSSYNLTTGEVWATSIHDGRLYNNWPPYAVAGFSTNGIQNTGSTPWRGVTVTATVQVISLFPGGASQLWFVVGYPNPGPYTPKGMVLPGPGIHTVTTQTFDMPPGATFYGTAHVAVNAAVNNGMSVYAKILSIKINL